MEFWELNGNNSEDFLKLQQKARRNPKFNVPGNLQRKGAYLFEGIHPKLKFELLKI